MNDRLLLSASQANIDACLELAREYDLGIELMAFSNPDILDGNWNEVLLSYQERLRGIAGPITIHGPFFDMVSGSPDERINEICKQRYRQALQIAADLGAEVMVVHANFIGSLHNTFYRRGWHMRNIDFWRPMSEYAAELNVVIAIENMWEFDPDIIGDLLTAVNHSHLKACLDVGHALLFSDPQFTIQDWFKTLSPWLVHTHMNNNDGLLDEHHGFAFADGAINYHEVLRLYRQLPQQPNVVLEMDSVDDMRESLQFFLDETA